MIHFYESKALCWAFDSGDEFNITSNDRAASFMNIEQFLGGTATTNLHFPEDQLPVILCQFKGSQCRQEECE